LGERRRGRAAAGRHRRRAYRGGPVRRGRYRRHPAHHADLARRDRHRRPRHRCRDGPHRPRRPPGRRELFAREEREFTVSDGTVVHGWLMRAPAASGPSPLLLDIHGGPHNSWSAGADEAHLYHQELVARGWAVLLLNPRGSDGYGERFYNGGL